MPVTMPRSLPRSTCLLCDMRGNRKPHALMSLTLKLKTYLVLNLLMLPNLSLPFKKSLTKRCLGTFFKTSSTNGSGGGGMGKARIPIFTLYSRNTWQVTCDTKHMSHDSWWAMCKNFMFMFNGLGFIVFWFFGGKGSVTWSISESVTEVFVEQAWLHRVC